MINHVWLVIVLAAVGAGLLSGRLPAVSLAATESAREAVTLALGLVGVITFWLGLVRILEAAGFLSLLAYWLRPVMRRLFPDVPPEHPAMSLMVLSLSANMLGLSNAATPFGLRAMTELERLNRHPGVATNAMALFLAINTSNLQLFPTEIVALRASLGSTTPGSIVVSTLLASLIAMAVAIVAAKLLERRFPLPAEGEDVLPPPPGEPALIPAGVAPASSVRVGSAIAVGIALFAAMVWALYGAASSAGWGAALRTASGEWTLALIVAFVLLFGWARNVPVYEAAVEGGKEGFHVAVRIIPYLVVVLVAVGMLRASGALDAALGALAPVAGALGLPAEAIPMGALRSLSGSGARGFAADIMRVQGADSLIGQIVSTIQGSTETTFYVLAVYFGAIQVRVVRHTLAACLIADAAGVFASVWVCRWLFG